MKKKWREVSTVLISGGTTFASYVALKEEYEKS